MSTPGIIESPIANSTTGCQSYRLTLTVQGTSCPVSFIPGIQPSCETTCALVSDPAVSGSPDL